MERPHRSRVDQHAHRQLRYDEQTRTWSLYAADRNSRWFLYDNVGPAPDVSPLLAEISDDPTCIFWG